MTNETKTPPTSAQRYVWECLNDDCKRKVTAGHQSQVIRCECGHAMMAVAEASPEDRARSGLPRCGA